MLSNDYDNEFMAFCIRLGSVCIFECILSGYRITSSFAECQDGWALQGSTCKSHEAVHEI